ncbi:MAG: hypothetical protein IT469_03110 [Pseudomonadales bacterium]|nr:hypothetical protein [Pseudomonadales bacterium]
MTAAPRRRSRRFALVAGAALLLLLSAGQIAAVLHDADHPFHVHQSLCDVFLGAQLQAPGVAALPTVALPVVAQATREEFSRPVFARRLHTPQQPRAPPALPTI